MCRTKIDDQINKERNASDTIFENLDSDTYGEKGELNCDGYP